MKALLWTVLTGVTIGNAVPVSNLIHSSNQENNITTINQNSDYQFSKTFNGTFRLNGIGTHDITGFSKFINQIWTFINNGPTAVGDFSVTSWTGRLSSLAGDKPIPSIHILNRLLSQEKQPVIDKSQSNITRINEYSYSMELVSWIELNGVSTIMNINGYSPSQLFSEKQMNSAYTYSVTIGYNTAEPKLITSVIGTEHISLFPSFTLAAPRDLLEQAATTVQKYPRYKITDLNMVLTNVSDGKKYGFKLEEELMTLLNLKILEKSSFDVRDNVIGSWHISSGTILTLNYYVNNNLETMEIANIPSWEVPIGDFIFNLNATLKK